MTNDSGDSGNCTNHWCKMRLMKYQSEDQDSDERHRTKITKISTQLKCMQYQEIQNFLTGKERM